jgi:hypothetical protein
MNKKYLLSVISTFCKIASFSVLTPGPSPTAWERGDHFKVKLFILSWHTHPYVPLPKLRERGWEHMRQGKDKKPYQERTVYSP